MGTARTAPIGRIAFTARLKITIKDLAFSVVGVAVVLGALLGAVRMPWGQEKAKSTMSPDGKANNSGFRASRSK